jgi:AraC-like DNA-binding protein
LAFSAPICQFFYKTSHYAPLYARVQNQVNNLSVKPTSPPTNGILPLSRLKLFSPIMHALEDIGLDVSEILDPCGLSVETVDNPSIFVHPLVMYGLVEAAGEAAEIRGFCTAVAENLDLSTWFPATDFVSEAMTIGDLMTRFTNACSRESTSTAHRLLIECDRVHFCQRRSAEPAFAPAHTDAFNVGIWVSILHLTLGDGWIASQVVVTVCDPDALPEHFHGVRALKGDRMGFSITFPASWLSARFDREVFDRRLESTGAASSLATNFVTAMRQALTPYLAQQDLNAERAAELCGFSKSTLKRRLAAYRTTIFQELDTMKKEVAIDALMQADLSIGDIAASVGYSDPTAFSRAFKRWTGDSPRAYRKNHTRED